MFLQSLEALRYEAPSRAPGEMKQQGLAKQFGLVICCMARGGHSYPAGKKSSRFRPPLNGRLGVKPKAKHRCSRIAHQLRRASVEMMFLTASTRCAHNAARETCQSFLSRRKTCPS